MSTELRHSQVGPREVLTTDGAQLELSGYLMVQGGVGVGVGGQGTGARHHLYGALAVFTGVWGDNSRPYRAEASRESCKQIQDLRAGTPGHPCHTSPPPLALCLNFPRVPVTVRRRVP